jgi:hypothetical protein
MDYSRLIACLSLPSGWAAPTKLAYDDLRASALTRAICTLCPSQGRQA